MELNKEITLLIRVFEQELLYFEIQLEELENLKAYSEESKLRLDVRRFAYESIIECMKMELDKFRKLKEIDIKSKNLKDSSDIKSVLNDLISLLNEE